MVYISIWVAFGFLTVLLRNIDDFGLVKFTERVNELCRKDNMPLDVTPIMIVLLLIVMGLYGFLRYLYKHFTGR
jgi:hypothetical protein